MFPAHQCFAGRHAAGAQIDQWLEVELEQIRSQGFAQVEFERAFPALLPPSQGEEAMIATAAILCGVKRDVGFL